MKVSNVIASSVLLALGSTFALPSDVKDLVARDALIDAESVHPERLSVLEPRAGGGGGKGGSSGGSSSSGSSSSSSGSSGSSSGSSSSGSSSGSRGSSVGTSPSYGRSGSSFAGGAPSAYRAGGRSPGGLTPFLLVGAGVGAIGLSSVYFASHYPYGAYRYNFNDDVTYTNQSANNQVVVADVQCLCDRYSPCSCDQNNDTTYVQTLIGNGQWTSFDTNHWVATVTNQSKTPNGTLIIDGTLSNGTDGVNSAAGFGVHTATERATWGAVAAAVAAAVMLV